MDWKTLGQNIKFYRIENKLRQEDLAEKIGLSINYVGMLERGEKTPALDTFVEIANALNVSSDVLLSGVLNKGFEIQSTILQEKVNTLSNESKLKIYEVVDLLIKHSS